VKKEIVLQSFLHVSIFEGLGLSILEFFCASIKRLEFHKRKHTAFCAEVWPKSSQTRFHGAIPLQALALQYHSLWIVHFNGRYVLRSCDFHFFPKSGKCVYIMKTSVRLFPFHFAGLRKRKIKNQERYCELENGKGKNHFFPSWLLKKMRRLQFLKTPWKLVDQLRDTPWFVFVQYLTQWNAVCQIAIKTLPVSWGGVLEIPKSCSFPKSEKERTRVLFRNE